MPSNGLCGFSCIAYSVTGHRYAYTDVINDSFRVFERNPDLYLLRTECGSMQVDFSNYQEEIRYALANVATRWVPQYLWLEDAHLIALSMYYDIAVFVFNGTMNQWLVYNDAASNGYICLYHNRSHFDVLQGTGSGNAMVLYVKVSMLSVCHGIMWHLVSSTHFQVCGSGPWMRWYVLVSLSLVLLTHKLVYVHMQMLWKLVMHRQTNIQITCILHIHTKFVQVKQTQRAMLH